MRTVVALLAGILLLANLACAGSCALDGCAPQSKLPPCHQQPSEEKACDHGQPSLDFVAALEIAPDASFQWFDPATHIEVATAVTPRSVPSSIPLPLRI